MTSGGEQGADEAGRGFCKNEQHCSMLCLRIYSTNMWPENETHLLYDSNKNVLQNRNILNCCLLKRALRRNCQRNCQLARFVVSVLIPQAMQPFSVP